MGSIDTGSSDTGESRPEGPETARYGALAASRSTSWLAGWLAARLLAAGGPRAGSGAYITIDDDVQTMNWNAWKNAWTRPRSFESIPVIPMRRR